MKNHTYYFFHNVININNFDINNVKIDEKSYKSYSYWLYWINHDQHSKYIIIYSVNSLYLIFNKVNGYFEEINGNNYLTLKMWRVLD